MGVHAHRLKFWPFHRRKLKLRLFGSYQLQDAHFIVTAFEHDDENGRVRIELTPYEYWREEVRIN